MTTAALAPALAAFGTHLGPWLGGAIVIGLTIKAILQGWQPFVKMRADRDTTVEARLTARVEKLEQDLRDQTIRADAEREKLENKIDAQRKEYERRNEQDRIHHEYDLREARHRANGAFQSLKLLVALLEADEETLSPRAQKALSLVRKAIEEEDKRAAEEREAIQRAKSTMADVPALTAA